MGGVNDNPFLQVPGPDPMRLTPQEHLALTRAPRLAPEKQWWNFSAKKTAGERIGREELDRSLDAAGQVRPHNNAFDAMRHARWSRRMATEIGPVFSTGAGLWHEGENIRDSIGENVNKRLYPERVLHPQDVPTVGQTMAESAMDLGNNFHGIGAALGRRPIDPRRLQTQPGGSATPYDR
jgi:hypothetical protein